MKRWRVPIVVLVVIGIAGLVALRWWLQSAAQAPGPAAQATTVIVARGSGSQQIAAQLAAAGAVDSRWMFLVELALAHNPSLKAGEYAITPHATMAAIIDMMHRGQVVEHKLTIPEGLTAQQVAALVDSAEAMRGHLLRTPAEGTLLPQTYFYLYDEPRDAILARMSAAMTEVLDTLWAGRAPNLPIADKAQAVILASIVERETAVAAERPRVAAVYENRLRQHMKLESDPTVIYAVSHGLGALDRPLSRADLATASPYNTYVNEGLPPGPICNPGRASIEAVLHPAASDDLYFVADGSGGHAFAKTLAQHNKNVEKWRQLQKNQANGKE